MLEAVLYEILSNSFQFLNNITRIFTHFFIHTYFKKIQTTLLEQCYQASPYGLFGFVVSIAYNSISITYNSKMVGPTAEKSVWFLFPVFISITQFSDF